MNRNKIHIIAFFLIAIIGLSSCEDGMEEITTLSTNRAFSPTDLTATVINKVNVKLTWKAVNNAKSFKIEIYDNATLTGTPIKTISDIAFTQVPYTVTGLAGNLQHSVRVKSISKDGIEDSKWISATFKTDPEQILNAVALTDITATSVKLTWPAGEGVTKVIVNPGAITYNLTPTDIAAGNATIPGLTGETLYTAKIYNNNIERGTATFTSAVDISNFTQVSPSDDLGLIIANTAGAVRLALQPGTYTLTADITANKNITIVGAVPSNRPVINRAVFKMSNSAGLIIKDVVLDGNQPTNTNQLIIYDQDLPASTYGVVNIANNEIRNYQKGLVYINKAALVESITFSGNIIKDINCTGASFIDFRLGFAKTLTFENNTIYNITEDGSRDLFRIDNVTASFTAQVGNKLIVQNNTFYNALNRAAGRYLYVRLTSLQSYFNKNIISDSQNYYTNQSTTAIAEMKSNNYNNAPNFFGSATASAKNDVVANGYTTLNPGFAAAATGDFTISNADLKAAKIGDPRWIK